MSLNDFTAPECQLSNCDGEAETTCEHPEFGDVQVCRTCANLWETDQ
jgi:hypothetical protein